MSWWGSRGGRDGLFPRLCRRRCSCCPACSGPALWGAVLSPLLLSGRWPRWRLGPRETRACTGLRCMSPVGLWGVMVVATGVPVLPAEGAFQCRGRGPTPARYRELRAAGVVASSRDGSVTRNTTGKLTNQLVARTQEDPNSQVTCLVTAAHLTLRLTDDPVLFGRCPFPSNQMPPRCLGILPNVQCRPSVPKYGNLPTISALSRACPTALFISGLPRETSPGRSRLTRGTSEAGPQLRDGRPSLAHGSRVDG